MHSIAIKLLDGLAWKSGRGVVAIEPVLIVRFKLFKAFVDSIVSSINQRGSSIYRNFTQKVIWILSIYFYEQIFRHCFRLIFNKKRDILPVSTFF